MRAVERRIVLRTLFTLVVLLFLGILAGVNYFFQRDVQKLVIEGNTIDAAITNKNCANAGVVNYAFSVAGKEYRGSGNACVTSCFNALIGEKVPVTYAIKNPQNSMCGSAEKAAARFNGNYYAVIFVGLGLLFLVFYATRRKAA
jgi:hypothetical protein